MCVHVWMICVCACVDDLRVYVVCIYVYIIGVCACVDDLCMGACVYNCMCVHVDLRAYVFAYMCA